MGQEQATPFSVKLLGAASLADQVPCMPTPVSVPPAAMAPSYDRLVRVTVVPLCDAVAPHALVTFWSPPYLYVTVQLLIADEPLFVIETLAVKPPAHSLWFAYVTWQPPLGALVDGEAEGLADADALGEAECDAEAEADGEADADAETDGAAL